MIKMLEGAKDMSALALSKDLTKNDPLAQAVFWVQARMQHIKTSVHRRKNFSHKKGYHKNLFLRQKYL